MKKILIIICLLFLSCCNQKSNPQIKMEGRFDHVEYIGGGLLNPPETVIVFQDQRTFILDGRWSINISKGDSIQIVEHCGIFGLGYDYKIKKVK